LEHWKFGLTRRFASSTLDKCNVNHFCHLPRFAGSWLNKWKVGPACEQYFVQFPRTLKQKIKDEKKRMRDTNRQPLFIYALFEHCSFSAIASRDVEVRLMCHWQWSQKAFWLHCQWPVRWTSTSAVAASEQCSKSALINRGCLFVSRILFFYPSPCPKYKDWFTLAHVQRHTYMWISRSRV